MSVSTDCRDHCGEQVYLLLGSCGRAGFEVALCNSSVSMCWGGLGVQDVGKGRCLDSISGLVDSESFYVCVLFLFLLVELDSYQFSPSCHHAS